MNMKTERLEQSLYTFEDGYIKLYKQLVRTINEIMEEESTEEIRFDFSNTPYWSCPTENNADNGTLFPIVAISTTPEDKLSITIYNVATEKEETLVPQYNEINLSDIAEAILELY